MLLSLCVNVVVFIKDNNGLLRTVKIGCYCIFVHSYYLYCCNMWILKFCVVSNGLET
jgi:hypothetical protein